MTCKQKRHSVTARRCNKPPKPDYIPGGGGFGFVLALAFILWLLGCSGTLSLIF